MRFDDSLETVLAADVSSPFGAQSAWRQLVDLIGRRRVPPGAAAMDRLGALRNRVPEDVRAASARGLAFADPPAILVRFFAADAFVVAAPVLRSARLSGREWADMMPALSPQTRSILRHRRDLAPEAIRALEAFGPADFVLGDSVRQDLQTTADIVPAPPADTPLSETSFRPLGDVARDLPIVAEALRGGDPATAVPGGPFRISELVARIDAYRRRQEDDAANQVIGVPAEPVRPVEFSFETDETGVVRWVTGVAREPLIGLSLDLASLPEGSRVDLIASGAFRRRASFENARLIVEGGSDAAGNWRISGTSMFDDRTGRFTGYRGRARRPRIDEHAERQVTNRAATVDSLRQLTHELRTPANAIAGFAEMIETQLLGEVAEPYRERAAEIRSQASDLLGAIEDLDTAARIDSQALDLRPGRVALGPLLAQVGSDLAPLAELRSATLEINPFATDLDVAGDERAVDRLISRLLSALVAAGTPGERIDVRAAQDDDGMIAIRIDRPAALAGYSDEAMFAIEVDAERAGGPLLGVGFSFRLARNLAVQLGGRLSMGVKRLTLRLPAAVDYDVGQASNS